MSMVVQDDHGHGATCDGREEAAADAMTLGSCEGGALPVIMSIIGPCEIHDYRNCNL